MATTRRHWSTAEPRAISPRDPETLEYTFEVITPVFGGGAILNQKPRTHIKPVDPVTPVRGATIRGHLRAWWRALYGVACGSIEEMRRQETALWGAASVPGAVSLSIVCDGLKNLEESVFESRPNTNRTSWNARSLQGKENVAYGAFPLQHEGSQHAETENGKLTRLRGPITLQVRVLGLEAAAKQQISDTVEAWLVFGGIGGRTRRGFGAVGRSGTLDVKRFASELALRLPAPKLPLPAFKGHQLVVAGSLESADRALDFALGKLRKFRQGERIGRNPGQQPNRPGRSRWPEADAIRRVVRRHDPAHAPAHPVRKFPRAAFGMPIIFHFQSKTDPGDSTLLPQGKDRLASPLRLGVARIGEKTYVPFALVFANRERFSAELKPKGDSAQPVETALRPDEAQWTNSPLNGQNDVLLSFLEFFSSGAN
jgi:CRISPR-associated protein Cmr1